MTVVCIRKVVWREKRMAGGSKMDSGGRGRSRVRKGARRRWDREERCMEGEVIGKAR